jgi:type VI secretion system protein ImpE
VSTADELLRAGDLAGARAALVNTVKSQPSDEQARMFLFQLLALAGEWDKARTQLLSLAQLSPDAQMLAVAYGQAIDAEAVRAKVFAGEAKAEVLANAEGWAAGLPDAIQLLALGKTEEGLAARDAAFENAPDCPGSFNDTPFEWIADCDSRFGPAFEAIIGGRYGLVPFDAVEKITSDGVIDLRDLVWFPVQIWFKTGQSVAGMLPARYPGTQSSADSNEQLARATSWVETPWGEQGQGQHLLMLDGDTDQGLLALKTLTFN